MNYSFVIPVYNSVATLEPLYNGISELMAKLNHSFEVIFVEDNGRLESWHKLLELKEKHSTQISIIKLSRNYGQNAATLCGINVASGDFIITVDDDLQVHPIELEKLIRVQEQTHSPLLYGVSSNTNQHFMRKTTSNLFKKTFNSLEGGANIGSSVRLLSKNLASHLSNHVYDNLFINQILSWYTFDTKFVEINWSARHEGKSSYGFLSLIKLALKLLFLHTNLPLRLMIYLCVTSSIISLALASYYIYQHFALGRGLGFLSLIVIAISLILASISVIGIYVNRLYNARIKKPMYAIQVKL
jgi:polyisoprenyl-phosphate glycosyltransferase